MTQRKTTQDLTIVILPGGPGLSGATLKELKALESLAIVRFIDPRGNHEDWSYEALLAHVVREIGNTSNIVLVGHSFGGLLAAELVCTGSLDIKGLVIMGTPFSSNARDSIRAQFSLHMTPELRASGDAFFERPNNETFRSWLRSYRGLYFSPQFIEAGSEMLASDEVDHRAYLGAAKAGTGKEHLLPLLKDLRIPKLFLAGQEDQLFLAEVAKQEAANGGFEFRSIKGAGHFMAFERPNEVLDEVILFLNHVVSQQSTEGV